MVRERTRVERECVREVRDVYDMSYVLVKDARLSAGDHRAELPAMRVIPHFSVIRTIAYCWANRTVISDPR